MRPTRLLSELDPTGVLDDDTRRLAVPVSFLFGHAYNLRSEVRSRRTRPPSPSRTKPTGIVWPAMVLRWPTGVRRCEVCLADLEPGALVPLVAIGRPRVRRPSGGLAMWLIAGRWSARGRLPLVRRLRRAADPLGRRRRRVVRRRGGCRRCGAVAARWPVGRSG